jgi:hypothetical protein
MLDIAHWKTLVFRTSTVEMSPDMGCIEKSRPERVSTLPNPTRARALAPYGAGVIGWAVLTHA